MIAEEGRTAEAVRHLRVAPELAARAADVLGEATALVNLDAALPDDEPGAAETGCTRALALATEADDAHTRMLALQVVADVLHNDVNSEGTESARYTCPVQASHVKVALPKDVGTTVNVMKADGSPGGVFSVCGTDFKVGAFAAR